MARKFTVFEKFGECFELLNEDDRRDFAYAITSYGMLGEEVELPYPFDAMFALVKEDIDNSIRASENGGKGGRPKSKNTVSEDEKPVVYEKPKTNPSQSKPSHTSTSQEIDGCSTDVEQLVGQEPDAASQGSPPYDEIIAYLNVKTGRKFSPGNKATRKHIHARWEEGYRLDDFKAAIDNQCREWLGNDMGKYLRPETLFCSKHFDSYVNNVPRKHEDKTSASPPLQQAIMSCPECGGSSWSLGGGRYECPRCGEWST